MAGFRNGAIAWVNQVDNSGKYPKAKISISGKNRLTDKWETRFNGYVSFVSSCKEAAANLKEGDRIQLTEVDVTNNYNAQAKREYVNFTVYGFEPYNGSQESSASTTPNKQAQGENPVDGSDDCPF